MKKILNNGIMLCKISVGNKIEMEVKEKDEQSFLSVKGEIVVVKQMRVGINSVPYLKIEIVHLLLNRSALIQYHT